MTDDDAGDSSPFPGSSQMADRMARFAWSQSPLGPPERWPSILRAAVRICLTSRFPMIVWWGEDLRFLYNDAYLPLLGSKHPALGKRGERVWSEIWHIIGPMLDSVLSTGEATWSEDLLLPMQRHGYWEETYWTYSYSPLHADDGTVRGVFTAVSETTERVVGERRLAVLQDLGAQTGTARTVAEACALVARTLADAQSDVPYAEIHLRDPTTGQLRRMAVCPAEAEVVPRPDGPGGWPLHEVLHANQPMVVADVAERYGALPDGGWETAPAEAMVLPLQGDVGAGAAGVVVLAASASRALDEPYRAFLGLVARQAGALVNGATAYQAQQQRVEDLAQLDELKTTFFSNISHEFRTPLTLIMGPLAELRAGLEGVDERLMAEVEVIHRNGLRLGKLVNTLLDFSRIEAGRMQARYEPVDLSAFTSELASVFRAAIDKAGLEFRVDCDPLPDIVFVDREMWEKVVFNLLSNALKFTFDGGIGVSVSAARDGERDLAEVRVSDTGIGVPAEHIQFLFQRFHRIPTARARSNEGSGIGLALVQELVHLHGGTIQAQSTPGAGTVFIIRLPFGHDHLPGDQVATAPIRSLDAEDTAEPYVTEALRWLPPDQVDETAAAPRAVPMPVVEHRSTAPRRILIADDNADMRDYLRRLLAPNYRVDTVSDGLGALSSARTDPPDLVISDVMMPGMDGLQLVSALRGDPRTAAVPILLLSARAGQESAIEGLAVGADDYLVKPFSAPELLARVRAAVDLASLRNHHARWRAALINSLQEGFFVLDGTGTVIEINSAFTEMLGYGPEGLPYTFPYPWTDSRTAPTSSREVQRALQRAITVGSGSEVAPLRHRDGHRMWIAATYSAVQDDEGSSMIVGTIRDVTAEHFAVQRESAVAAMGADLAQASGFDDVMRCGVTRLAQAWGADRVLAVRWDKVDQPGVISTAGEPVTWVDLDQELRERLTALRERAPLSTDLLPAGRGAVAGGMSGAGTTLTHPDGVLAVWLEFDTPRPFGSEDQALLSLLAGMIGQALHRAYLFDQQREVALTLQRAILGPAVLPYGFTVRYEPATPPLEVGGDWFDAIKLPQDKIGIVVGDCVGRGLPAATVMGQLRSACRALLLQARGPAQTLSALDEFAALLPEARCTTVFCGVLDSNTGELVYSSAGHPPSLLLDPDGAWRMLEDGAGLPLAIRPGRGRTEASVRVPAGGALLCYTDGLVERRRQSLQVGIDLAAVTLRDTSADTISADAQANMIMAALQPRGGYDDDVAMLLYRRAAELDLTFPAEPNELAGARAELREWLRGLGVPTEFAQDVLVAVGEACANSIEHGHQEITGTVTMTGRIGGERLHVVVSDTGRWLPPRQQGTSHRGRGFAMMRAMMDQVAVTRSDHGTTVDLSRGIPT